jgi:tRNA pseudouridine38-40 synthase
MRLRLTIAYDGGPYTGWQSQSAGNAVQDFLEQAFWKVAGTRMVVHGSGRTDAGVHALGQCAHVEVLDDRGPIEWRRALNVNLPQTIRVLKATRAAGDFHARFSAKGKVYRYLVCNRPVLPPLELGRVWHVPQALDLATLQRAAALFTGRHDFGAFSANRGEAFRETVRTIRKIDLSSRAGLIILTFEGDGFLYRMVRMMTAAMIRAAQHREDLESLRARLETGAPKWNHVAPAEGLYLVKVLY